MFGTLRYNAQEDNTHFIERTADPADGEGYGERPRHAACDKCRSKKQRCGGQQGGCDRCKRNRYTCVYSLQGKGKGNRQRRNHASKQVTPPDSSVRFPGIASAGARNPENHNNQGPSKQVTPPAQHLSVTQNLDGSQDGTHGDFSPIGSFDYYFPMSDQMTDDILPDFDGQSTDTYLDSSTMSSKGDMDFDDYFASGSIGSSPIDAWQPLTPVTEQKDLHRKPGDFNLTAYLSQTPITSTFDTADTNTQVSSQAVFCPTPSAKDDAIHQNDNTNTTSKCRCLNTISLLLEGKTQLPNPSVTLDLILASQKETLARCHSVLDCSTCPSRPEYVLLLGMVIERLVSLYESTMDRYFDSGSSSAQRAFPRRAAAAQQCRTFPRSSPSGDGKIFLGGYEIDTPDEYNGLMRLLIAMQLQGLWKLMTGMNRAGEAGASVTPRVYALERRVMRLIRRIRQLR